MTERSLDPMPGTESPASDGRRRTGAVVQALVQAHPVLGPVRQAGDSVIVDHDGAAIWARGVCGWGGDRELVARFAAPVWWMPSSRATLLADQLAMELRSQWDAALAERRARERGLRFADRVTASLGAWMGQRWPEARVRHEGASLAGNHRWRIDLPLGGAPCYVAVSREAVEMADYGVILFSLGAAHWLRVLPSLPTRGLIVRTTGVARPYDPNTDTEIHP